MTKKFAGNVAVIAGGSTGMGLATAKRFVREAGYGLSLEGASAAAWCNRCVPGVKS